MRLRDLDGNFAGYSPLAFDVTTEPRWQLALEVGVWFNQKYGDVPITPNDLAVMLANFKQKLYPQGAQELPVDYEHLSIKPDRKAGDGIAAGWIKDLELRGDGSQLWALVEWTEPAREKILKKEYKGFSPFFHPDWSAHGGKGSIGPTLLGGAVTNYQTIPNCVITCSSEPTIAVRKFASIGDLAFSERETRVRAAFDQLYPMPRNGDGFIDWTNVRDVRDVTEDRVIFSYQGKKYALKYSVADDLSVTFEGDPFEVVILWDPVVSLSHEGFSMKLKGADGKDVEIPAASFAGLTLDQLSEVPAVKTLRDQVPAAGKRLVDATEFDTLQATLTQMSGKIDTLTADNTAIQAREKESASKLLANEVDALIREGRALPTEKDELIEMANTARPLFDKVVTRRRAAPPIIALDHSHGADGGGNTSGNPVVMFDALIAAKRAANKDLTMLDAVKLAQQENPELARARNVALSLPVGPGGMVMTGA